MRRAARRGDGREAELTEASRQRIGAVISVIRALEAGAAMNTREIAERMGCGVRTAQRWMPEIERFVPLIQGPDGRWMKL